jgi:hypothetical protein
MEANEVREKFRPLEGKRIKVRGSLSAFRDWQHNYREVGRACISQPEVDHEVMAHHVWIMGVQHWQPHRDAIGRQVEFDAVVTRYYDRDLSAMNFSLANPSELSLLHGPPGMNIPEPPDDARAPEEPANGRARENDSLETLRRIKAFVKAVGGSEAALRVVSALGDVNLDAVELARWVDAYCSE